MKPTTLAGIVSGIMMGVTFGLLVHQGFTLAGIATVGTVIAILVGLFVAVMSSIVVGFISGVSNFVDQATGGIFKHLSPLVFIVAALLATIEFGAMYLIATVLEMQGFAFMFVVGATWLWGFYISSLVVSRIAGVFGALRGSR